MTEKTDESCGQIDLEMEIARGENNLKAG